MFQFQTNIYVIPKTPKHFVKKYIEQKSILTILFFFLHLFCRYKCNLHVIFPERNVIKGETK